MLFIIIPHKKHLENSIFLVNNGRVTPYDGYPNGNSSVLVDQVITKQIDMSGFHEIIPRRKPDLNKKYVPEYLALTLSIRYDTLFLENLCGGDHECAVNNVYVIVSLANTFYQTPDALGTRVFFNVKEIDYFDAKLRLRSGTVEDALDIAQNASENNPLSVDHYHYFTHDENSWSDTLGVAITYQFKYDNGRYGKNSGSYCLENQNQRAAISEYRGTKDDWEIQKLEAVRTFAHELGHALGMPHDFNDQFTIFGFVPCYDSKGQDCLKMKGIMSYESNVSEWSTCSKEGMNGWFGELQYFGYDCWNRLRYTGITDETTPIPFQSTQLNE